MYIRDQSRSLFCNGQGGHLVLMLDMRTLSLLLGGCLQCFINIDKLSS